MCEVQKKKGLPPLCELMRIPLEGPICTVLMLESTNRTIPYMITRKKDSFNRMQHGTGLKLSHHLVPHFSQGLYQFVH